MVNDGLTLLIGGKQYGGWTNVRVTSGLGRSCTDFSIGVTERWTGQSEPWRIVPFAPCQIMIGNDAVMTGYVNNYTPSGSGDQHSVSISGRSKTQDLVDCTPDIKSGQFSGYGIAAIARAIGATFNPAINVVADAEYSDISVANVNLERGETAWAFLERLCRLAGILATDDAAGNLVLTDIANSRASGRLVHGQNILSYSGKFSSDKRFSIYVVEGQVGIGVAPSNYDGAGGIYKASPRYITVDGETVDLGAANAPPTPVQTQVRAEAFDTDVPRYRPRVTRAESQLDPAGMQLRANWQRNFAYGKSIEAQITVKGWRQPDGTLWRKNQVVPVSSPMLGVDQDLLVVEVSYELSNSAGRVTSLTVAPVLGYVPDPGQVKLHKAHGKNGSGVNWSGAGGKA
jgi:prophage tail gpP-like protein